MRVHAILAAPALLVGTGAAAFAQQGLKVTSVLESTTTMTGQPVEYLRTDTPQVTVHPLALRYLPDGRHHALL